MKKILFVCTGNTCRSCMAEGIFKAAVAGDLGMAGEYSACSAGISAFEGGIASENAIRVLKDEWRIDISTHRSRNINENCIKGSDLVLTMTREHKNAILRIFPESKGKVYTLKEFVMDSLPDKSMENYNYNFDITDPYGMSMQAYKKCAYEIRDSIEKLVGKLKISQ